MKNPTPNTYLLHLLHWPTDVTPTSNNCSSDDPLIRNQMAHTPVDTSYAAPVNTPILPMPYLVPKTLSIFNIILLAHLSVLSTPLLVPNAPFYILVKLAISSIPDLENTSGQKKKRNTFPLIIRMMMTSTLQFILTYPTTQSMTWEFLLFYTHQPKNCPEKPWRKKIIFELETITPSGLNKQFSFLFLIA